MASSEVDQKFLGRFAKNVENENPLLASMLFKILGLSANLSQQLVQARRERRKDATVSPQTRELHLHIIWLAREGLVMLEQYVLPVVGQYVELKVLAYKLRASFYHIFVQFYNQSPVSTQGLTTPETLASSSNEPTPSRANKGKGVARDDDMDSDPSSVPPTHLEGGPVKPPPGFGPAHPAAFLLPPRDYLPIADQYFRYAIGLADSLLWGSHSLRLSVKTEYCAFLYDCMHDFEGSRALAKDTISEVYDASEGIDNDMFGDACELVTVLGKMMKRGLNTSSSSRSKAASGAGQTPVSATQPQPPPQQPRQQQGRQQPLPAPSRAKIPPPMPKSTGVPTQGVHPDSLPEFI